MQPGSGFEVLCAGIVVADAIASAVDAVPPPGLLTLVDSVQLATGGCALSTATALVRLGTPTPLCGCVGRDLLGEVMRRETETRGIGTQDLRASDSLTSASVVLDASDGERTFLHNPGANCALSAADVERALGRGPRWLHIGGALVLPARRRGPRARRHRAPGAAARVAPHLDMICPNLTEARGITGQESSEDCAASLREHGVRQVAVKLGRDGAFALDEETSARVPSFPVDTRGETGADDAFAGGLIHGLLNGWPLAPAVRLGNAVGALSTRGTGASSALPDLEEALAL